MRVDRLVLRCTAVVLMTLLVPGLVTVAKAVDFQAGWEAYKRGDYAAALRKLHPLAEQDDAKAQIVVSFMYAVGQGAPQSYAEAAKWRDKIIQNENVAEAVKWFRKSAEQEYDMAQFFLGAMYAMGLGVPKDDVEAVEWFSRAAGQGFALAQFFLGVMYAEGQGVPKELAEAVKWYRRAAEQGNALAQFVLGAMYGEGRGVPQNNAEAVKWYRKAAEQGDDRAQNNLGDVYANGLGVPQDDVEAYAWFHVAAAQGHTPAAEAKGHVGRRLTDEALVHAQRLAQEYWEAYVLPFRN